MDKKVTIIIPLYNMQNYIGQCLESALNQTYKNIEIIVIDDASTDDSKNIVKKIMEKNKNVFYIKKEQNTGISDTRNIGIINSNGDYLFFLDSDDYINKNTIKTLMRYAEREPLDIMQIELERIFNNKMENIENNSISDSTKYYTNFDICKLLMKNNLHSRVCGALIKRELFTNIQFPKGKYFEDLSIYYKLVFKSRKIGINNSKFYGYRFNHNSITTIYSEKKCKDFKEATDNVTEKITEKYPQLGMELPMLKISNYLEIYSMKSKKYDSKIFDEINMYLESKKTDIQENYNKIPKILRIKLKMFFTSRKIFLIIINVYRRLKKFRERNE